MQNTAIKSSKALTSTIAAIATPPGNGGIGIVRLSGPKALTIAAKMFKRHLNTAQSKTESEFLEPRVATFGKVLDDTAIAIYYKAPHSFTGEDVVEFQCHGGWLLLNKVTETAIKNGAVAATNGEFSRRAFMNGKLSLDQAEAIIEMINAESEAHLKYASAIMGGALNAKLTAFENSLVQSAAQIEATLDYPEHDIEHTTAENIRGNIITLLEQIKSLTSTARAGQIIANGINIAVLGLPNVGKSSIFNALLNTDRSIVTEIPGTTTDTVTDAINYNGIKMIFHDTAGIREGKNKIERLGIKRTQNAIEKCDIALVIFDVTDIEVPELLETVKHKPHLVVYNKSDLAKLDGVFCVSAKTGENIQKLKQKIYDLAVTVPPSTDQIVITNARHAVELTAAQDALETALTSLTQKLPLDCVAADITAALAHIGNITGTHTSEAVLDEIFSRFCLGK